MPVSIKAMWLSGTPVFPGVAAGLGVGIGVDLGTVVCGRVWAVTITADPTNNISAPKTKQFLFISFPSGSCSRFSFTDYTDWTEKEKGDQCLMTCGW
jgi:hypothetical protein